MAEGDLPKPEDLTTQEASPLTALERLHRRSQQAEESLARRASDKEMQPKKMFLPGFDIGAMPNHLNRSSLIAPIARGRRKFHRQSVMVSRSDCVLEYTGEQLDEADGDIIMALIFFAQPHALGTHVPLNRAQLLRKIKRDTGKQQYEWLHRRLKALKEATLFLQAKQYSIGGTSGIGKTMGMDIIQSFIYDDDTETYHYALDPRWVRLFSNREYSLIDWDKRMLIGRGQDMAKTLQRLVATSSDQVQRYALDWLKEKMEYTGRLRDFREAVDRAVHELERLEIIVNGTIEESTRGKPQLVLRLKASG